MTAKGDTIITVIIIVAMVGAIIAILAGMRQTDKGALSTQSRDLSITTSPTASATPTVTPTLSPSSTPVITNPTTTPMQTTLKIEVLSQGTGTAVSKSGDKLTVNYKGTLENGTVFDSSYSRNQPFSFTVGVGQVIKGWDQGMIGMKVGEKRRLTIPGSLAYGSTGVPGTIPANATLIFEVEMVKIN